jgi:hypothetical protein
MTMLRFPSVAYGETNAYLIAKSYDLASVGRNCRTVVPWARTYDTYGDRDVQHSHEYNIPEERLVDFLESLGVFFLSASEDEKAFVADCWRMYEQAYPKDVLFYAGLKHNEKKDQYYHPSDLKVTTASSKQYDKRWLLVPSRADGSAESIFGLMFGRDGQLLPSLFESYRLYSQIGETLKILEKYYVDPYYFIFPQEMEKRAYNNKYKFERVFMVVSGLIEGYQQWLWSKGALEKMQEEKAEEQQAA